MKFGQSASCEYYDLIAKLAKKTGWDVCTMGEWNADKSKDVHVTIDLSGTPYVFQHEQDFIIRMPCLSDLSYYVEKGEITDDPKCLLTQEYDFRGTKFYSVSIYMLCFWLRHVGIIPSDAELFIVK